MPKDNHGNNYTYICAGCKTPILDIEPAMMKFDDFLKNSVKGFYHKKCLVG